MARPKKPKLSAKRIAEAAMQMISQTGAFTIPGLAEELGVKPSSLYNHVSGRDAILELIRRDLHEAMAVRIDVTADWRDTIRALAAAQRSSLARHPRLIPLLATSPAALDDAVTTLENFAIVLSRAGFDDRDVFQIIGAVDIVVIGASLDLAAPEVLYPPSVLREAPTMARVARAADAEGRADTAFDYAIEMLIEGLEARLNQT